MIDGYIYGEVNILTTGTEFYSKVLEPYFFDKEWTGYLFNRFNSTVYIEYIEKESLGVVILKNNDTNERDILFLIFWFLDNNYKSCRIDKEDASFVAFSIRNFFDDFEELSENEFRFIEFDLSLEVYHFYYSFYDNPCDFHVDYFKKFFIKELGLEKDYNKYLEGLHGEEVF